MFESYDYDAYGNRFLFQGRECDYTTQLNNFRARWISNDPIGGPGLTWCGKSGRLSG